MKRSALLVLLVVSIQAFGQSKSPARPMARSGEGVWVCLDPIKKDKRAQYERFLHDIFWAGASKLSPADQRVFRQTRILHPTKAEADGTYSYFFVMDPVIKGANYDIESMPTKMYGKDKATQYFKLYTTAHARPQVFYEVTQSKD
ncbi:hypothetical protein J2I47_20570 [Fibrella sp. HMF5335]|uniref:Uncharacterized protein n=1 Tax=Fibrella rubiginis TaxID=2817060 RepID=A0A939GH69_9BACT|nr:hypothetical protein [Fibrella rubiginis]MBO0938959.1 hypothetical protein [Fibrella rubiginis]